MKDYPVCPKCNSEDIDMELIDEHSTLKHNWGCACNNCGHRFGFSVWYVAIDNEYWTLDE